MGFPAGVDEITTDWLRQRLAEARVAEAGRLRGFRAEPVAKQGMTSLAHVLTLDYDGNCPGAPGSLLAKFSLDLAPVKEALAANRGFEREVTFYTRFGDRAGIPVPRCYWARHDAEANRCGLLLEYIPGMRAADQFSGTVDEVAQVVPHLATFHARWWGRDTELAALPQGLAPFMVDLYLARLRPALETVRSRYRTEVGDTLIELIELWIEGAHRIAESERRRPRTLCHGDLHREQILFPTRDDDTIRVIDWQLAAADGGATDLAHLLTAGLRPGQRAEAEAELVARYRATLAEHGVEIPADDVEDAYRLGIARLAVFYMTAFAMGDITPAVAWWEADDKRKGVSFWEGVCGWTTAAVEANGVIGLLRRYR